MFLGAICECIFVCGFFSINGTVFYEMNVILLIFSSFTTYYILGYQIYLHRKIAIGIISINIITLYAQQTGVSFVDNIFAFYQYLVLYCCAGTLDVYQKYLMDIKYFSPFRIVFFQGLFSSFMLLIGFLFVIPYIPCQDQPFCISNTFGNFTEAFSLFFYKINANNKILLFVFYVAFCGFYILILFFTNKNFTPTHRIFCESLASLFYYIANENETTFFKWLTITRLIIVLLISLIYNDIIILNFCGLGINARKNIIERGIIEKCIIERDNTKSESDLIKEPIS